MQPVTFSTKLASSTFPNVTSVFEIGTLFFKQEMVFYERIPMGLAINLEKHDCSTLLNLEMLYAFGQFVSKMRNKD